MKTITDEQVGMLPPGTNVTVTREEDGYMVRGVLIGLMHELDGARLRVLPEDNIERRVPLPARVTVNA